tara:strand:- start:220 stop:441 length:222 start_codon:yes stop_codon:yes gene_type:complete
MCWIFKILSIKCENKKCKLICCGYECCYVKSKNYLKEEVIDIDKYWENIKTNDLFLEEELNSEESDEEFPLSI